MNRWITFFVVIRVLSSIPGGMYKISNGNRYWMFIFLSVYGACNPCYQSESWTRGLGVTSGKSGQLVFHPSTGKKTRLWYKCYNLAAVKRNTMSNSLPLLLSSVRLNNYIPFKLEFLHFSLCIFVKIYLLNNNLINHHQINN